MHWLLLEANLHADESLDPMVVWEIYKIAGLLLIVGASSWFFEFAVKIWRK